MNYILDTCVLSETIKPMPDPALVQWLQAQRTDGLFISTFTLGELRKGIGRLPPGIKRHDLQIWLAKLADSFQDRFLSFDEECAMLWGGLCASSESAGTPLPVIDGLIAAVALQHGGTLVTRNERDYIRTGVPLLNPWSKVC